ncbi:ubiquinol-cytochrome C reductase hinge protein-domain-containing protein [Jimgerdemannia flammicorona]|uniref:Ubiquinol-cytochrome C reductase hinge protein-domain-containing protein n=1 Tax=Jimgerdemannia flammicorona TaxID=994334 RepID=A0A432ZZX3_9FUNG|nr:ubiquinol-cytochrome C reductase hinge protein-domain-containing protein [Jimgerdemannia flammicorona]
MGLSDFLSSFIPAAHAEEAQVVAAVAPAEPEPEDTKPAILEGERLTLKGACQESKECTPLKHHLDECAARVEAGSHENCIEEFFHLMHCADTCVAPKLFATLK